MWCSIIITHNSPSCTRCPGPPPSSWAWPCPPSCQGWRSACRRRASSSCSLSWTLGRTCSWNIEETTSVRGGHHCIPEQVGRLPVLIIISLSSQSSPASECYLASVVCCNIVLATECYLASVVCCNIVLAIGHVIRGWGGGKTSFMDGKIWKWFGACLGIATLGCGIFQKYNQLFILVGYTIKWSLKLNKLGLSCAKLCSDWAIYLAILHFIKRPGSNSYKTKSYKI